MRTARATIRNRMILAILAAAFPLISCGGQPSVPMTRQCLSSSSFISAHGTVLCWNGAPLRLIGYNWHWVGTNCEPPTESTLDRTFTEIRKGSKANIVRAAFYQSGSNDGVYTEFNRYIAAAKRYHLYILPILVNQWVDCEPSRAPKTIQWYQTGYKVANDGYPLSYRDYVRQLVAHFANEPTIAFWQLVNEPDAQGEECGVGAAQALRAFADEMVSVIKSVDPHHMVDLGTPGDCAADNATDYETIVASSVDVADVWHDYHHVTVPLPTALQQRMQVLQGLHKPAYVGESGICADVDASGFCTGTVSQVSLAQRASFFDAKLAAGFHAGLSGYIIWNKGSTSMQDDVGPQDPTESVLSRYAMAAIS